MTELLRAYQLEEILIILIIGFGALFTMYKAYVYLMDRKNDILDYEKFKKDLPEIVNELRVKNDDQDDRIDILIESDRSRIKGELLKQLAYFKKKGSIDIRSWEYIHQIYDVYKKEGGNSWAEEVVKEIDSINKEV